MIITNLENLDDPVDAEMFARFMTLVNIPNEDGACWEWRGNRPSGRYGHFSIKMKTVKAHRWMYKFIYGSLPDGMLVRHKCDNPACVNPIHLEVGTAAQNTADMHFRGRGADRRGHLHPLARLKKEDIMEIRRLHSCGASPTKMANDFKVSTSQIGRIVRREGWKNV